MRFQTPLVPATLIRRYKRFLSDMRLGDGQQVVAHCANPGSMLGLKDEGIKCWLEPNDDPKKKLKFGWRLIEHENGHFTGIDTGIPNRVIRAALENGAIPELATHKTARPEVKFGENSRVDFLLSQPGLSDVYVEVKSVTLSRAVGIAEFPDSVTARGSKHLAELTNMVNDGHRAVMFYLVQRTDCTRVTLAKDIDPDYARHFAAAVTAGVEVLAYDCQISPEGIELGKRVLFEL